MGFSSALKSLWCKSGVEAEQAAETPPAPFKDLKLNKHLTFDSDEIKLLSNETLIDVVTCPKDMQVKAHSVIELGAGHKMERFYVDDAYFQIAYEGLAHADNIQSLHFVSYDDSYGIGPQDHSKLEEQMELMKADKYNYRDKVFTKLFRSEFEEIVTSQSDCSYSVFNQVAVFSRELESGAVEQLIVTAEECDGITVSFALALEVPLSRIETALA